MFSVEMQRAGCGPASEWSVNPVHQDHHLEKLMACLDLPPMLVNQSYTEIKPKSYTEILDYKDNVLIKTC